MGSELYASLWRLVRGSAEFPKSVTPYGKSPEAAKSHELDMHSSLGWHTYHKPQIPEDLAFLNLSKLIHRANDSIRKEEKFQ